MKKNSLQTSIEPVARPDLEAVFHPRSVVVAGVTSRTSGPERSLANSAVTNNFFEAIKSQGFGGPLYAVNPRMTEFMGLPCYPSLRDVPDKQIDYVVSGVPAAAALDLVEACGEKSVRLITFFTAGFSETDDAERAVLERRIVARAKDLGMRVLGPNCIGLYNPAAGVSFMTGLPREAGPVSVIAQSGGNANDLTRNGAARGLRFRRSFSYGNAVDINEADLFELAGSDPETTMVAAYIEGVRDGRRFARALRACGLRKPTVVLKGGRTEAGGRATRSHTGSLAGSQQVFEALCRQAAAVHATSLEEVVDACVAFAFLDAKLRGPGIAVVGGGGGASVLAADEIASAGLTVPPLTAETQKALLEFTPVQGTSVRNPIDTSIFYQQELVTRTLELVAGDPGIDVLLYTGGYGPAGGSGSKPAAETADEMLALPGEIAKRTGKPVALIARAPSNARELELTTVLQSRAGPQGIATFPTIGRAARAISAVLERRRLLES